MYPASIYNVMVASPGDVAEERQAVRSAIGRWNDLHAEEKGIVLLPIGWDTHAYPTLGSHPQDIVNKQVASRADILVAVFGARIGTPTEEHISGTVEEIEGAIVAGKPVLVYLSSGDIRRDTLNVEQYTKLEEFKKGCQSRGLYAEYDSAEALQTRLQDDLVRLANDRLQGYQPEPSANGDSPELTAPLLSDEAKRLLKTAASGDGEILKVDNRHGLQISVGNGMTLHLERGRQAAVWESAIGELEAEGLLQAKSYKRTLFAVTRNGYEYSEKMLDEEWIMTPGEKPPQTGG